MIRLIPLIRMAGLASCLMLMSACGRPDAQLLPGPYGAPVPDYEAWLIDQSDSPGRDHGGLLYVFDGVALARDRGAAQAAHLVDLGDATSELCRELTGADPVRPHMVLFNDQQTHASIAFVASGHVVMMDAATREPVDCLRASRAPGGQQAHAAFPAPDGSYVIVANQDGKRLERIDSDFAAGRFRHNETATLDLSSCMTPSGAPCEAPGLRPDNAPICPIISDDSALVFVTLRGGGLLVVDPRPEPMRIIAEYDLETVRGNGCGGIQVDGSMYVNSGGRPGAMDHLAPYGFDVYRFALEAFEGGPPMPPNQPAPVLLFRAEGERDSHGMVVTGDGQYLWVMDRHADLADISPDGGRVYVALRGPTPLSGDPHSATGATPGLGIMEVHESGSDGRLAAIVPLSNIGDDGIERADPHGLRVRWLTQER
ncbi:MAG: hypothetical protein JJT85_05240 [Chromatiales bacterium]|nr:hypothetical protein [Chromatiales bacterium]